MPTEDGELPLLQKAERSALPLGLTASAPKGHSLRIQEPSVYPAALAMGVTAEATGEEQLSGPTRQKHVERRDPPGGGERSECPHSPEGYPGAASILGVQKGPARGPGLDQESGSGNRTHKQRLSLTSTFKGSFSASQPSAALTLHCLSPSTVNPSPVF